MPFEGSRSCQSGAMADTVNPHPDMAGGRRAVLCRGTRKGDAPCPLPTRSRLCPATRDLPALERHMQHHLADQKQDRRLSKAALARTAHWRRACTRTVSVLSRSPFPRIGPRQLCATGASMRRRPWKDMHVAGNPGCCPSDRSGKPARAASATRRALRTSAPRAERNRRGRSAVLTSSTSLWSRRQVPLASSNSGAKNDGAVLDDPAGADGERVSPPGEVRKKRYM